MEQQKTNLADNNATELLALFRSGQASPVEATQAVLARIDQLNPRLNAFRLVAHEQALQSARHSEARWQKFRRGGEPCGALEGVPVSIKDLVLTRGWSTLRGSRTVDPEQAWDVDAPATSRLREAGAVLLGKTNTPEFGCKGETNSPLTGITRNPWNPARTPGGSSGGAAAAVASGMGPLALGTDGAGSVRIPSAFCGNFGLKPSFGRVPAYPLSPMGTVAHLGPHAMTVPDAALMMNVLKRPDARDWTALPADPSDYAAGLTDGQGSDAGQGAGHDARQGVRGLRIAWSPTLGYAKNVQPDVAQAVAQAVRQLEALGAHVEQVDPGIEDPLDISTGLWFFGAFCIWQQLTPGQQAVTDPDFRAQAMLGEPTTALQVHNLNLRRHALGSHMRQFMTRYDLLATPTLAVTAFEARPAGHTPMDAVAMLGWTPFSYPFNLTQQPACTIPCGLDRDGLPIGLQLVGPMFGDALVLRAARAYELARPIPRPDLGKL
jgi:aspartyl-tRNA(Asn)/glutamyl-tRNA(Gln) amidotransferase subunit A